MAFLFVCLLLSPFRCAIGEEGWRGWEQGQVFVRLSLPFWVWTLSPGGSPAFFFFFFCASLVYKHSACQGPSGSLEEGATQAIFRTRSLLQALDSDLSPRCYWRKKKSTPNLPETELPQETLHRQWSSSSLSVAFLGASIPALNLSDLPDPAATLDCDQLSAPLLCREALL